MTGVVIGLWIAVAVNWWLTYAMLKRLYLLEGQIAELLRLLTETHD